MKAKRLLSNTVQKDNTLSPDPIDKRVGSRIRLRRRLLGYSQEKLALALDLSFQQIQKYEKGLNRVGASRLYYIAQILQVPVGFFFDEMLHEEDRKEIVRFSLPGILMVKDITSVHKQACMEKDQNKTVAYNVMNSKETIDLLKAFYNIKDEEIRKKLLHLIQVMAE